MKKGLSATLLALAVASTVAHGQGVSPKIGVMFGSADINSGDISSVEKICILQSLTERTGVSFKVYENHRNTIESVEAAKQMVKDGVSLALLPVRSDEAIAAVPILREANIPYVTSATSDSVIKSEDEGLSVFSRNQDQAKVMAQFYIDHYADRPLAVVTDESSAYSRQLSSQFIADMHVIDASISIKEYEIVGETLEQLPNLSGHAVFAALYNPEIALLYRQMRNNGDVILLGTDSVGAHNRFLDVAGRTTENNGTKIVFLRNWDNQIRGNRSEDFRMAFFSDCGKLGEPTFGSAYMYDIASLAIEWALSDGKEAPLSMAKHTTLESIFDGKAFTFSENGYRKQRHFFYEFAGGTSATPLY